MRLRLVELFFLIFVLVELKRKSFSSANSLNTPPRVVVEQGELFGTYYTTISGKVVNAFYGVPYAAPPVYKYRFKPPQPLRPWAGYWNATVPSKPCYQYSHAYIIDGEEDCLYLNIFTPELPVNGVSKLLDVIVYIHGGAFMFGSGLGFLPDYLLEYKDVVFVALNYRLGPLGFFSTGDEIVPGNNGLKDQVAALKWIHTNIVKFGGNPSSVTITGMSAGGASVHYHYLSPLSQGLFQRGVSFSGSIFPTWTLPKKVTENSLQLASLVGCSGNVTKDVVKCLQKRPAKQIVAMVPLFMKYRYCPFTVFGPVIEPAGLNSFLSENPLDILSSGRIANVPWLATLCKDEGLYPVADMIHSDEYLRQLDEDWDGIAPYLLHYNHLPEESRIEVNAKIKEFYFGSQQITKQFSTQITQMAGDWLFYVPVKQAIKLHATVSSAPVYCYTFNYRGKYSLSNKYTDTLDDYGVSHGDDLMYIVKVGYGNSEETESDRKMMELMTTAILSFIQSGKPDNIPNWSPVLGNHVPTLHCLEINSTTEMNVIDANNQVTLEFWSSILPEQYQTAKVSERKNIEL